MLWPRVWKKIVRRNETDFFVGVDTSPWLGDKHYRFGVHEIQTAGEGLRSSFPWPTSARVSQTVSHIFVYVDLGVLILPRRDFESEASFAEAASRIRSIQSHSGRNGERPIPTAQPVDAGRFEILSQDIEVSISKRYRLTRVWLGLYVGVPCAGMLLWLIPHLWYVRFRPQYVASGLILLAVTGVLGWSLARFGMWRIQRAERQQWQDRLGTQSLSADANGVRVVGDNEDSQLEWTAIREVSVRDGYCHLEIAPQQSILIPARAFPGRDEFAAYVAQLRAYRDAALASA